MARRALGSVRVQAPAARPGRAARRLDAPGQPASTPSGTSSGTRPAQSPPDARPALGESEVQALVERWRTAQNDGDFDAYAALYGDGFEGVKRAGEAEQRFDRAGWLDDRKRMFARPMHVAVGELRVQSGGQGARAEFVQTWSSGGFGDRGRKRMDIELRGDGLRIAREEMLDSRIVVTETQCLQMLFPRYSATSRRIDAEPDAARVESVEVVEPNDGKAIGPEENAIVYTIEEGRDGPMIADTKERVVLYRVTGASLEELLALESHSSGGEGDSATRETFSIDTDSVSNGLYDIKVERIRTENDWHANEHSEHRDTDRYQWDGAAYEEVAH
jgi:ketosteroid isomerase-like protein